MFRIFPKCSLHFRLFSTSSTSGRVLITGGSSGIGKSISTLFASNNFNVLSVDINQRNNTELESINPLIKTLTLDISKEETPKKSMEYMASNYNGIDILINNAAIQRGNGVPLHELPIDTWDEITSVNFRAVFLFSKYYIQQIVKQMENEKNNETSNYSIINMASVQGLASEKGVSAYSASKGGILALTKQMAVEYAPYIRVMSVSPGTIKTPLVEQNYKDFGVDLKEVEAKYPVKRLGEGNEVAELVYFLCSDKAKFITGENVVIDGGIMCKGGWSWHQETSPKKL